jgi:hypothetical protein
MSRTTINRRQALAAGAAAALAVRATTPAFAAGHPDARLLELGRQFDALVAEALDAERRSSEAARMAEAQLPAKPETLRVRPEDAALSIKNEDTWGGGDGFYGHNTASSLRKSPRQRDRAHEPIAFEPFKHGDNFADFMGDITGRIVKAMTEPWPEAQARADEIVAAYDAWNEYSEPITAADEAWETEINAIHDAMEPICFEICTTPARTREGLHVKFRVLHWYSADKSFKVEEDDTVDGKALSSLVTDLAALEGWQI